MLKSKLSDRLRLIRWSLPAALSLFAAAYQISLAIIVQEHHVNWFHYGLELFLYAAIYPVTMWFVLGIVRGWVELKEQAEDEVYLLNAELQRRVDERTRELQVKAEALSAANERLQELDGLKSEFVSLVSHELRAPLTNVRGAVELMEKGCPASNATCDRMFKVMGEQTTRLARLVDDVLNVSRIESGGLNLTLEAVDLVQIVEQAVDALTIRQPSRILRKPVGKAHPMVRADADRLYEVIGNLVDNAVKYSPSGSEVSLDVHTVGGEGVVSVSDHGHGIPPKELKHVFEKFFRLDTGDAKETYGYGLGLYLCRRFVEAMDGRIWVESEPGEGATFRFTLPLAEPV